MSVQPKILSETFVDLHRFRIVKFRTRFNEIEFFVYDAADISDDDRRAGKEIEPFFQGDWSNALAAIWKRSPDAARMVVLRCNNSKEAAH
jgi:hypothetical protein